MRRLVILAVASVVFGLLAANCGGGSSGGKITPLPGNSELVVGPNRFALGLIDQNNEHILGAGNSVHLQFQDPSGGTTDADASFIWAIPDVTGFWVANVTFSSAGTWDLTIDVTRGDKKSKVKANFTVSERGNVPMIGDAAPPADNLTLPNADIKRISTDPQPDQDFYRMTVTQALAAHKPFVVVFATPLFCQTQFCGPVLNNVKAVAPEFKSSVNFIHIEPYELDNNGHLVTDAEGSPVVVAPTDAWHLLSEPWIFVVDADGHIADRFESAVSDGELRAAIGQVAGS